MKDQNSHIKEATSSWKNNIIKFIFFGNYFYGLCAIGLSIEASLQQSFPLNNFFYYIAAFAATALYYTKAYITEETASSANKRTDWYVKHKKTVFISQVLLTVVVATYIIHFFYDNKDSILLMPLNEWLLAGIFPLVAGLYYGINLECFSKYNLRNIGWLKPFIIGFSWAGIANIYPVLAYCIEHDINYQPTVVGALLFLKNFMYVTVLCIMFDIKDYAMDHNLQIKTFVVKMGLRKTIFYIIIPLCITGLGFFITYALIRHFSIMKILLNVVPFVLLITVAYSLHRRKSIFYYLIIIDGLMLVKAICGSIAMTYF